MINDGYTIAMLQLFKAQTALMRLNTAIKKIISRSVVDGDHRANGDEKWQTSNPLRGCGYKVIHFGYFVVEPMAKMLQLKLPLFQHHSSRRYLHTTESPYALHPTSNRFPQVLHLKQNFNAGLIDDRPFSSF